MGQKFKIWLAFRAPSARPARQEKGREKLVVFGNRASWPQTVKVVYPLLAVSRSRRCISRGKGVTMEPSALVKDGAQIERWS